MEDGRDITQAKVKDPRITRIGRFIRRYNVDELPQLINVLRGNMLRRAASARARA